MRLGQYEVIIVDDDSIAFKEHNINGAVYVCGKARREYRVSVRIYRDEEGNFPVKYSHVSLSVDDVTVNYRLKLRLDDQSPDFRETFQFRGFRQARHTYRAFQFSVPTDAAVDNQAESRQGCIRVAFFEATVTKKRLAEICNKHNDDTSSVDSVEPAEEEQVPTCAVPRNKKYLQRPSLATTAGNIWIYKKSFRPKSHETWNDARAVPDASLEIWYHSDNKLKFLQEFYEAKQARAVANAVPVDLTEDESVETDIAPALVKDAIPPIDLTEDHRVVEPAKREAALVTPPCSSSKAAPVINKYKQKTKREVDSEEEPEDLTQPQTVQKKKELEEMKSKSRANKRSRVSRVDSLVALTRNK